MQRENELLLAKVAALEEKVEFLLANGIFPGKEASKASIAFARVITNDSTPPYTPEQLDVVQHLQLLSKENYEYMIDKFKFALPSTESVLSWQTKPTLVRFDDDVKENLHTIIEGMTEQERTCAIQFDS